MDVTLYRQALAIDHSFQVELNSAMLSLARSLDGLMVEATFKEIDRLLRLLYRYAPPSALFRRRSALAALRPWRWGCA
jgi:hypothetical protein